MQNPLQQFSVILAPLQQEHIERLVTMLQSPHVHPYIDLPVSSENFLKLIEQSKAMEALGVGLYRVIFAGEIAGMTGYTLPEQLEATAVLGTWLGSSFHGKGINPLVKLKILQLAFSHPEIKQVIWLIHSQNIRAIRASHKLPYAKLIDFNLIDEDFRSYQKWYEFKTGTSTVGFIVSRGAFQSYLQTAT